MAENAEKPRLLTGDRPTGALHLGHLVGSLRARVARQDSHDCFLIVADLHTLTTRPQKSQIGELPQHVRAVVLDLLSVGIDPDKTTIYLQSGVPAVYDLAILLQMLVPASQLRAIDSLREMARVAQLPEDDISLGLLGYPVLQAADILMARAQIVPVGVDNEPHVRLARELAERFNAMYGEVFPLPQAEISQPVLLPGVGPDQGSTKMSKSAGNVISLADPPDVVTTKIRSLDAQPGQPEASRLFAFVDAFLDDQAEREALMEGFRSGQRSQADVHDAITGAVEAALEPIRARRAQLESQDGLVEEILVDGTFKAREVAYETLQRAREAMGLDELWKGLVAATEKRAQNRKRPHS
jgi:tryptophanyl-tRNA synthetase